MGGLKWRGEGTEGATGVLRKEKTRLAESEREGGRGRGVVCIIFNVNESHSESN